MDDLVVPAVRKAPRFSRAKLGHFVDDVGYDGFAHFLAAYRAGMAELPPSTSCSTWQRVSARCGPTGSTDARRTPAHRSSSCPGRNASTPMWRVNLPVAADGRTVYCVDLLGEAGLSVQDRPITGPDDQAQWLDEALGGLGLDAVHLMGVSIGGWTATNCAVRRPAQGGVVDAARSRDDVRADSGQDDDRVGCAVRARRARGAAPPRSALDRRRGGRRRLAARGRTDLRGLQRLRAALTDAEGVHRRSVAFASTSRCSRSWQGAASCTTRDRAAARARDLLPNGQIELWPEASHAINGEYPDQIAAQSHRFWDGSTTRVAHRLPQVRPILVIVLTFHPFA